jgi:hypothetical protein
VQESFLAQMQDIAGILPDAGPLSAEFRQRFKNAIYLLLASIAFGILAIFIGLPTLVLRPSKFVICMTLATICAAGSVILLQKPSVFLSNLIKAGPMKALPIMSLLGTMLFTAYITIFVHKYIFILIAAGLQILSLLWYLSSYIPGGTVGLKVLLRTAYTLISTAMKPCIFLCKRTLNTFISQIFS